jgi:hypothetical protein
MPVFALAQETRAYAGVMMSRRLKVLPGLGLLLLAVSGGLLFG